jgi:hypothetical protein
MTVTVKAIVPTSPVFDTKLTARLLELAVNATADAVQRDFQRTVTTWKRRPPFAIRRARVVGTDVVAFVGTDNDIYGYVTRGTRPHVIRPVRAKTLKFRTGYRAKTSPGFIGARPGGAFGSLVSAREVRHPGTKARNFEETIAKNNQRDFQERIDGAIRRGTNGK